MKYSFSVTKDFKYSCYKAPCCPILSKIQIKERISNLQIMYMGVWFFTTGRNSGLEGAQGSKSLGRISESHVLSDSWFGALYST